MKSKLVDNQLLLGTYQINFTETGQKYEDALLLTIDPLNTNPNFSGGIYDHFHNEVFDRDVKIGRFEAQIGKERKSLGNLKTVE